MRKTLIALLLAITFPAFAMAMPDDGEHHGGRLLKELDLSQEQRHEIRQLMSEQMKGRHEITQRYLDKLPTAEKKAMEDELEAAKAKSEGAIRALLEPEQQKAFDAELKKMQERRAERAEFEAWKAQRAKAE